MQSFRITLKRYKIKKLPISGKLSLCEIPPCVGHEALAELAKQ